MMEKRKLPGLGFKGLLLYYPNKVFVDDPLSDEEQERFKLNSSEIFTFLGPYPTDGYRDWISLSNLITHTTLARLMPECGRIYSSPPLESTGSSTSEQRLTSSTPDALSQLQPVLGTELRLTRLPSRPLAPPNSSPSQVTLHALDQTYTLEQVLSTIETSTNTLTLSAMPLSKMAQSLSVGERELLGELQFTFLTILLNNVFDSWTHWRNLVTLITSCESVIGQRPHLYSSFVSVWHRQLAFALPKAKTVDTNSTDNKPSPLDLLDLVFASNDKAEEPLFLPSAIQRLVDNVTTSSTSDLELRDKIDGFASAMSLVFPSWSLRRPRGDQLSSAVSDGELLADEVDWDTEDAPVIVEL